MATEAGLKGAEVRLERLCKIYGSFTAVDDITATVAPGEFLTILGPSGSGKTTTMMMIAGFTYPTRGEISVDGRSVAKLPPQRRGLGMVFQNYAIFPHLTIFENVAFPLRARNVPQAEISRLVDEMLNLVHLPGYGARMPQQLSGGQQQRVALARALIFRPRVLLMDEPLGALDRKLRDHMQTEIRRIHRTLNVTIIYVTHDQDEALTMSDRVAIMNQGRIEQIGTPADLYETPATRFVADFLGEQNFIEGIAVGSSQGEVRVRTADGWDFVGIAASRIEQGARVVAAVRPERLAIGAPEGSAHNRCNGSVRELIYAGDVTRCRVGLREVELTIKTQNRQTTLVPGRGEPVSLSWATRDMRVFPL
ncbi:MAG: ABC transporter ATP-binding protein [Variibacter sp.]